MSYRQAVRRYWKTAGLFRHTPEYVFEIGAFDYCVREEHDVGEVHLAFHLVVLAYKTIFRICETVIRASGIEHGVLNDELGTY